LRQGSSGESDRFLLNAYENWRSYEDTLGIDVDARVVAFLLSRNEEIDKVARQIGLVVPTQNIAAWRYNTIYGLLCPRGWAVRQASLVLYNPYYELPKTERLLLHDRLQSFGQKINLEDENWQLSALETLANSGFVTLECPISKQELMTAAFNFFGSNPVESEYLSVYARPHAIRRVGNQVETDLEIPEVLQ